MHLHSHAWQRTLSGCASQLDGCQSVEAQLTKSTAGNGVSQIPWRRVLDAQVVRKFRHRDLDRRLDKRSVQFHVGSLTESRTIGRCGLVVFEIMMRHEKKHR